MRSKKKQKYKTKQKDEIVFNVSNEEIARLKKTATNGLFQKLASRSDRFIVALIDFSPVLVAVIVSFIYVLLFNLIATIENRPMPTPDEHYFAGLKIFIDWTAGLLGHIFGLISCILLWKRGQTIGKYFRSIKIVEFKTGEDLDLIRLVGIRPLPLVLGYLFLLITVISGQPQYALFPLLFLILDALFIFRDDRRCIHDLISGAKVVECENSVSLMDAVQKNGMK